MPKVNPRNIQFRALFTKEEHERLTSLATSAGVSMADVLRMILKSEWERQHETPFHKVQPNKRKQAPTKTNYRHTSMHPAPSRERASLVRKSKQQKTT